MFEDDYAEWAKDDPVVQEIDGPGPEDCKAKARDETGVQAVYV